jgi:hypothetical protein
MIKVHNTIQYKSIQFKKQSAASNKTESPRTFRNGKGRAPLVLQNVETDTTFRRDIGMEDLGGETDFRRLERICQEPRGSHAGKDCLKNGTVVGLTHSR